MKKIGIICEYNPFHNGHIYHINQIKNKHKECTIILVMTGNYTQRGIVSLIDKWDKTKIALNYVDLVIELPFVFTIQSADTFAKGAIEILKNLNVDTIIFGTETLKENELNKINKIEENPKFNTIVQKHLNQGNNYPTSLAKATYQLTKIKVENPNDLLAVSYAKALKNTNIKIETIKRKNNYHNKKLEKNITSATSIRTALKNSKNIKPYVPQITYKYLQQKLHFNEDYFPFLKYKIISEINHLDKYLHVDEGIENKIAKNIYECNNLKELIERIKNKRFTYNKLNRMLICILCGFTKKEAQKYKKIEYIRVLGFNTKGKKHLKEIKKITQIPIITKFEKKYPMLKLEIKVSSIYYHLKNNKLEYQNKPIIK